MDNQSRFTWNKTNTRGCPPPPERYGAASVVYQNKLFIHGGNGEIVDRRSNALDDFWCYDYITHFFQKVKVFGKIPNRRYGHALVVLEEEKALYLFGGQTMPSADTRNRKDNVYLNDLWKYNVDKKIWTQIDQQNCPRPRSFFVSFMHEGKLFVFGGDTKPSMSSSSQSQRYHECLNDLHSFDFNSNIWTEIQTTGIIPTCCKECAWGKYDNSLIIHGGREDFSDRVRSDGKVLQQFLQLDLDTFEWSNISCNGGCPPLERYGHSSLVHDNCLYLLHGIDYDQKLHNGISKYCADVFCFDFRTKIWSQHWSNKGTNKENGPIARIFFVAQLYKENIYIFGGTNVCSTKPIELKDFSILYKLNISPVQKSASFYSGRITSDLFSMVNNPKNADVCFLVDGENIYAHKCILSVRSCYFEQMFNNNIEIGEDGNEINIDDGTSPATFLRVMEFLYTGGIRKADTDIADLLVAAEKYGLHDLNFLCAEFVYKEMSTKTAVQILVTSHKYKFDQLKENAMDFVISNWNNPDVKRELNEIDDIYLLRELVSRKH